MASKVGSGLFTGDYLLQVVGSLVLVIGALIAVMMILKRFNTVGRSTAGSIQVLASTAVGQRERVVLLQVGADQLLVGVASGSVTTLHQLSDPIAPSAVPAAYPLKELWNFARTKQGGQS